MSLINQLLVDLRDRQARLTDQADLFALGVTPIAAPATEKRPEPKRIGLPVIATIAILLVGGAGTLAWLYSHGKLQLPRSGVIQEKIEPPPNLPVAALAPNPLPPPPPAAPAPVAAPPEPTPPAPPPSGMAHLITEEETVAAPRVIVTPTSTSEGSASHSREVPTTAPLANRGNQKPGAVPTPPPPKKVKADPLPLKPTSTMAPPVVIKAAPPIIQRSRPDGAPGLNSIDNITSVGLESSATTPPSAKPGKPTNMIVARKGPESTATLDTVMPLQPAQSLTWARTLLEEGQYEEAERVVRQQTAQEGESPAALGIMAVLEQKRGNLESSNRYYNRLLRLEPDQYRWWLGMAVNMDQSKHKGEAISFYKHVIKMNPPDNQVVRFAQERLRVLEGNTTQAPSP
ncbi:MAG: tetratricopeptide repeat protein [Magnetococcales bacterium]|nr:tetratricopeptide repeat protein [Magnetococcales bacterium]